MAVAAYSDDESRPDPANHLRKRISRLERAINIARSLGRKKPLHVSTFERLDHLVDELATDPANASLLPDLLNVIFDHQLEDAVSTSRSARPPPEELPSRSNGAWLSDSGNWPAVGITGRGRKTKLADADKRRQRN